VKLVRYTGDADYSALYVDGVLDTFDTHAVVKERIAQLVNVEEYNSNYFLLGGDSKEDVAGTTAEIDQYAADKHELEREAADLRRRADELMARASRKLT
jgi:hypothetical protein